ncbi:MAG: flagellar filament capping protein FliD [Gammaproteobacteria bacterium]|nr:flagellar filament capping protein FliD [Gammaproteobacteria bacterium]
MITAAGVGSGIDVESIITSLMELERQPIEALNSRRQTLDVEISAMGLVRSSMTDLATSARLLGDDTRFGPFQASTTDEDVFTATATGGSSAEFHSVEVLSLAQNHRVASGLYASSEASITTGTMSFSSGDNTFDITVDGTNNTLVGLRDAINDATENTSISASILNVDGGSRLVLNAREGGTDNAISVSGSNSLASNLTQITEALDAELIVDGFAVTNSSNSVSDVIEGVTLELKAIGTADVQTQRDTESLRESLDTFVTSYNDFRTGLESLSSDQLQGDQLPRNAEAAVRNIFIQDIELPDGQSINPLDLGFTFDRYGALSIDEKRLENAQAGGMESFIEAFATLDTGFSTKIEDAIDRFTGVEGIIAGRQKGLENRQGTIDSRVEQMDYRLENTEARYRRQFTVMDQLVSQLQSTSSYLVNQLDQ